MRVLKKTTINRPIDEVWKVLAEDFDKAYIWMSAVPNSFKKDAGELTDNAPMIGRVCEFTPNPDGLAADETITAYNAEEHTMTVHITPINGNLPIVENNLNLSLNILGPNKTEVTWEANLRLKAKGKILYPALRLALGKSFADVLEELKYFTETGKPHPRKLKKSA